MHDAASPRLFCFGLGYAALAIGHRLREHGWKVAGTVRHAGKAEALRARGFEVYLFGETPLSDARRALAGTTHLLSSVPPRPDGDPVLAAHALDISATAGIGWIGYLSTTGVYGDRAGGWVDETSDRRPTTERGRRRVAAEDAWTALGARMGVPVHLLRLAGIYGPGRNQLASLAAGTAQRIDRPGQVFSRIHVDDIAAAVEAAATSGLGSRAFNICDDEPAPPAEVVAHAARLLGIPPPPLVAFEEAELSAMGRSFYSESKRVSNADLKRVLGVRLAYPTYREGLAALAQAGEGRP